jgi:hypothetical protein
VISSKPSIPVGIFASTIFFGVIVCATILYSPNALLRTHRDRLLVMHLTLKTRSLGKPLPKICEIVKLATKDRLMVTMTASARGWNLTP